MKAWDAISSDAYYKEVSHILEQYTKIYEELMSADEKMVSLHIKKQLKTLKKHFMVLEFMAESKSGRYVPLLIAKKANQIFVETNKILLEEESEVEK